MNQITGKEAPDIVISGFKGLHYRSPNQTPNNVPPDHLTNCNNCIFPGQNLVGTREGITTFITGTSVGNTVISHVGYSIVRSGVNQTSIIVLIKTAGGSYIVQDTGTSTYFTVNLTGAPNPPDDIVGINIYGRCFLSLRAVGKAFYNSAGDISNSTFFFDGTNFIECAGAAPTSAPTLTQTLTGIVPAGIHTVAYCYYYKYGYISPPSTAASITSDGSHNIYISGLPGSYPTNVLGVVLLITQANQTELFFVSASGLTPGPSPGNEYITVTATSYNDFDTSLIESADYLQDLLTYIPSCASIKFYNGRLMLIGCHGIENLLLCSNQESPETFDQINGVITLPIDFAIEEANSGLIINATFYIIFPNGTMNTQDNDGEPATWPLNFTDAGLGGWDTGVSNFGAKFVDILDYAFVCSPRGVMLFTGSYHDTPLTYKIEALWRTINTNNFWKVQIAHDIWAKRIYVSVPLGGSPNNNYILMGDYQEGLDPTNIKWSQWFFTGITYLPKIMMLVYADSGTGQNVGQILTIAGIDQIIYTISNTQYTDNSYTGGNVIIPWQIYTFAAFLPKSPGSVNIYNFLRLNISFTGSIIVQAFNADQSTTYSIRSFNDFPISYQGQELETLMNVLTEKIIIKLAATGTIVNYPSIILNRIDIYGNPWLLSRPALQQSQ